MLEGIPALRALRASLDAGGFLVAVVLAVVLFLLLLRLLRREGGVAGTLLAAGIALLVVAVSLAGIAGLTLLGEEGVGAVQRLELDPILGARGWSGIAWRPVVDNVTLFVPFGAALRALWCRRPARTVLAVAIAVSLGVEAFQWAVPTGRIANSADIVANTIGATFGVLLARVTGACPRPVRGA